MASEGRYNKDEGIKRDYLLVAAIDFGTTFSGYAFSFKHEYKEDPLKISANTWTAGSGCLQSLKTSTCILFEPNGDFHSFGFEAEDKYSDLALDNKHHDWYYFRRFKMQLYNVKNLERNFVLEDDNGKSMPAMKVFSSSLRYLKDHMKQKYQNMIGSVSDTDILWVITVPAIWSDSAKQFMTEAAEQAGIKDEYVKIALEPEAASLFCKYLPTEKMESGGIDVFNPGYKYMVLDAGGGTVDITLHQVQDDRSLRELHTANGGDWGGVTVDTSFLSLLEDIVGNDVMQSFNEKHKIDILDLLREFELKKRNFKTNMKDNVTFRVPSMLNESFEEMKGRNIRDELESKTKYKDKLVMTRDKIRMSPQLTKSLFQECSVKITNHIKNLLNHPSVNGIDAIVMVGGFSECPIVQEAVQKCFPKVIVPNEAGLSVLKGAVIFGHEPTAIKSRIMQHTYGIATTRDFDDKNHPKEKKFYTKSGKAKCKDIFSIYVEKGQTVDVDKLHRHSYGVLGFNQTDISFSIYASESGNPKYITDSGCNFIGKLKLDMPDTSKGLERAVVVSMLFGGTKLEVRAEDKTTETSTDAKFDFL